MILTTKSLYNPELYKLQGFPLMFMEVTFSDCFLDK